MKTKKSFVIEFTDSERKLIKKQFNTIKIAIAYLSYINSVNSWIPLDFYITDRITQIRLFTLAN